jgi:large repetitive protein
VGVPIAADKRGNRDYTITLTFGSSTKRITIADDDPPLLIAHDILAYQEDSSNIFGVEIEVTPDPKENISFVVSTVDGTAKAGSDYKPIVAKTVSGKSLGFSITIDLINDTVVEETETFYLDISNVTGATIERTRVTITIEDDDEIEVLINETTVMEGNTGQTNVPIVLRRTGATKFNQFVSVESRSGTAGAADFTAWTQSVIFYAGGTEATHTAIVRGDTEDEHDETVEIIVRYGGRIVGRGTLVIRDDDGPPAPPVRRRRSRH